MIIPSLNQLTASEKLTYHILSSSVEEAAEDVQIVLQERRSALERLSGHSTPPLIHGPPSNDDLADLERLRELRNAEQSVTVPLVLGFQRQRGMYFSPSLRMRANATKVCRLMSNIIVSYQSWIAIYEHQP